MEITHALSIREPWAWLIAAGFKTIENRVWKAPQQHIGRRFAIHAAKSDADLIDERNYAIADIHPAIDAAWNDSRITEDDQLFHLGAIIGTVELVACESFEPRCDEPEDTFGRYDSHKDGPAPEIPYGAWASGPYCFVLARAVRFAEPIACPGRLNFWPLNPQQAAAVAFANRRPILDPGKPSRPPRSLDGPPPAAKPTAAEKAKAVARAKKRRRLMGGQLPG